MYIEMLVNYHRNPAPNLSTLSTPASFSHPANYGSTAQSFVSYSARNQPTFLFQGGEPEMRTMWNILLSYPAI